MGFFSHVKTGFKAIVGTIAHSIVASIFYFIASAVALAFGFEQLGISVMVAIFIIGLIIGVFLLGWIYNKLWGWD